MIDMDIKTKIDELAKNIGNTPVIKLADGLFGKLEGKNPAGSVKDRAALYIIKNAIESGALKTGGRVAEATSGNTGIGLAYVCQSLGIKFVAVMPSSMSKERIALMEKYGATVVLSPAEKGMNGAVTIAKELESEGAFMANQFSNPASIEAHYRTTAPELFAAVPDARFVVCGVGSGGTAMGIKKYIDEKGIDCSVVAVEPFESPLLSEGTFGPHKIQGIGANFVPAILDIAKLDRIVKIKGEDAVAAAKTLYGVSGEKCGISSGAAYLAALGWKEKYSKEKIVVILPDGGDRYPESLYN